MEVLALPTIWAASASKKQTAVLVSSRVGSCETGVFSDIAPCLRLRFAVVSFSDESDNHDGTERDVLGVAVLPVTPCPLVDRESTRLNSSHSGESRMPSSA